MTKSILAALAAVLVAGTAAPAFAKQDCDGGYKTYLGKMVRFVDTAPATTIADALRKGLVAYDSCKAGNSFSPQGVWDQIVTDMEKTGK